jgi:hypothetical protein
MITIVFPDWGDYQQDLAWIAKGHCFEAEGNI